MEQLTGSIVALVTPMHDDGSVDYPALRRLIDWHIDEGTDCLGVVGTTGDPATPYENGVNTAERLGGGGGRECSIELGEIFRGQFDVERGCVLAHVLA